MRGRRGGDPGAIPGKFRRRFCGLYVQALSGETCPIVSLPSDPPSALPTMGLRWREGGDLTSLGQGLGTGGGSFTEVDFCAGEKRVRRLERPG